MRASEEVQMIWDDPIRLEAWLLDMSKFEGRLDLVPEMRRCLSHPDGTVRAAAIRAIGYYLQVDDFADTAESYFDDPSQPVRLAAILTWSFYFYDSNDQSAIAKLIELAKDSNRSIAERAGALGVIPQLLQGRSWREFPVNTTELARVDNHGEFDSSVDWGAVEDFVESAS